MPLAIIKYFFIYVCSQYFLSMRRHIFTARLKTYTYDFHLSFPIFWYFRFNTCFMDFGFLLRFGKTSHTLYCSNMYIWLYTLLLRLHSFTLRYFSCKFWREDWYALIVKDLSFLGLLPTDRFSQYFHFSLRLSDGRIGVNAYYKCFQNFTSSVTILFYDKRIYSLLFRFTD